MATMKELLDSPEMGDEKAMPATDEAVAETPQDSPEFLPEKTVPLKALEAERHKRQSYEQTVQEIQRQNAALIEMLQRQQQAATPAANPPDFLTENERWQQYLLQNIGQLLDARDQQAWTQRVQAAEEDMREEHQDYDALIDTYFKPAAQQDPTLQQKLRTVANPAKYAYREAKRRQAEAELGGAMDLDKLKAKVEAEVRAKVLAELEQKQAELKGQVKLPVSLGATGTSAPTATDKLPEGGSWRARDLF